VAEATTKETEITRKERNSLERVQMSQDFLLIQPFRSADFEPDLRDANARFAQQADLILRNVVIEQDHAAVLAETSLTTPRRIKDSASRTASALMILRYCLATSSAE
jgi:hypothetical protein